MRQRGKVCRSRGDFVLPDATLRQRGKVCRSRSVFAVPGKKLVFDLNRHFALANKKFELKKTAKDLKFNLPVM